MFYPSFIEKSAQDKLKITILEFAPKKERKGKYEITKKKQVKGSGFIYEGSLMDRLTGISNALGTKKFEDVTEKLGLIGKEKAIAAEVIASVIKYDE